MPSVNSIAFMYFITEGNSRAWVQGCLKHWISRDRSSFSPCNRLSKRWGGGAGGFQFHFILQGHHLGGHWLSSLFSWKNMLPTLKMTTKTLGYPATFICVDFCLLFAWYWFRRATMILKRYKSLRNPDSEWQLIHHKGFPSLLPSGSLICWNVGDTLEKSMTSHFCYETLCL